MAIHSWHPQSGNRVPVIAMLVALTMSRSVLAVNCNNWGAVCPSNYPCCGKEDGQCYPYTCGPDKNICQTAPCNPDDDEPSPQPSNDDHPDPSPSSSWCNEVKASLPSMCHITEEDDCLGIDCSGSILGEYVDASATLDTCASPITLTVQGSIGPDNVDHVFNVGHDTLTLPAGVQLVLDLTATSDQDSTLSVDLKVTSIFGNFQLWKASGKNPASCPSSKPSYIIYIGGGCAGLLVLAVSIWCCCRCCCSSEPQKHQKDSTQRFLQPECYMQSNAGMLPMHQHQQFGNGSHPMYAPQQPMYVQMQGQPMPPPPPPPQHASATGPGTPTNIN